MQAIAMTSPTIEWEEMPTEQILKWAARRLSPRVAATRPIVACTDVTLPLTRI